MLTTATATADPNPDPRPDLGPTGATSTEPARPERPRSVTGSGDRPWRLDESAKARGRAGIALARAQLRAAHERRARQETGPTLELVA